MNTEVYYLSGANSKPEISKKTNTKIKIKIKIKLFI